MHLGRLWTCGLQSYKLQRSSNTIPMFCGNTHPQPMYGLPSFFNSRAVLCKERIEKMVLLMAFAGRARSLSDRCVTAWWPSFAFCFSIQQYWVLYETQSLNKGPFILPRRNLSKRRLHLTDDQLFFTKIFLVGGNIQPFGDIAIRYCAKHYNSILYATKSNAEKLF